MDAASPVERNRLLTACTGGLTREDVPRLRAYTAALEEAVGPERNWIDRFSLLGLRGSLANLADERKELLPSVAGEALSLLTEPIPEELASSANRHNLVRLAGGILRVAISDSAHGREIRVDADAVRALLLHEEPSVVVIGTDICLIRARHCCLPEVLVKPLQQVLSRYPASDGGLGVGGDLKESNFVIRDGVDRVLVADEGSGEEGLFAMQNLTGVLETLVPADCSWRAATALAAHADCTEDANPQNPRRAVAGASAAGEEPTVMVNPTQPGPFSLAEVLEHLGVFAGVDHRQWPEMQDRLARDHEGALRERLSVLHREMVKTIFSDGSAKHEPDYDSAPFGHLVQELIHRSPEEFVPLSSFVQGILEDPSWTARESALDPLPSTELLAYYVDPRCLSTDNHYRWGIYFRVTPFARLARHFPEGLAALVESVATHEIVHHHAATRSRELNLHRECGGFWALEEAAADWTAVQHLKRMLQDSRIPQVLHDDLRRIVFPTREEGGTEGYGDWPHMDRDAVPLSPWFQSPDLAIPAPRSYQTARHLLVGKPAPESRRTVNIRRERSLWERLYQNMSAAEVPMYLDFQ